MTKPDWCPVPGTNGAYEVSFDGRVRALLRRDRWGNAVTVTPPYELKQRENRTGYKTVCLRINGVSRTALVHRLVLKAYCSEQWFDGAVSRHLDGDRTNNHLENLKWGTPQENERDKISHGTSAAGSRNGIAKLTEAQARDIAARYRRGNGYALARELGVSPSAVMSVVHGRQWASVTGIKASRSYHFAPVRRGDGQVFPSTKAAADAHGVRPHSIRKALIGKCQRVAGYTWEYVEGKAERNAAAKEIEP